LKYGILLCTQLTKIHQTQEFFVVFTKACHDKDLMHIIYFQLDYSINKYETDIKVCPILYDDLNDAYCDAVQSKLIP
jgi:hypothetical protein